MKTKPRDDNPPPGPQGLPFLGVLPFMQRDIAGYFSKIAHRYGDVARFKMGSQCTTLISHPEDIKKIYQHESKGLYDKRLFYQIMKSAFGEGLLVSNGKTWQHQRRLLQPYFLSHQIAKWHAIVTETTRTTLEGLAKPSHDGKPIDIAREMMFLTQVIMIKIIFGEHVQEREVKKVAQAIGVINNGLLQQIIGQMFLNGLMNRVLTPRNRRYRNALNIIHESINGFIQEQRTDHGAAHREDLMSLLKFAKDEDGKQMTETQLRDEIITIFLAGQETTASALAWTCYFLAHHPQAAEGVYAETNDVFGEGMPAYEDLSALVYTRSVIQESMRLLPPAYAVSRTSLCDNEIGGFLIPEGSLVVLSQYVTHRHPKYWDDPERFNPTRFLNDRAHGKCSRDAFFPFGRGQRTCIGMPLAMMEMTIIMAMMLQRYQLKPVSGHKVAPQAYLTLRPRNGIPMRLRPRRR